MDSLVSLETIGSKIFHVRGKKIMLDKDLAMLYGVSTKRLNEQVNRNMKRFPDDFMFRLTKEEVVMLHIIAADSRSQIATLKQGQNIKYLPHAFTEQGVAMLSTVLNSERAIEVNIIIMRAFVKLREILSVHKELACKLGELERKLERHDTEIQSIFDAIRQLMVPPEKPKRKIGFLSE